MRVSSPICESTPVPGANPGPAGPAAGPPPEGADAPRVTADRLAVREIRYRYRVCDLPRSLQPREKLARLGERALSNSELLAVILGTGTREENVLKIADSLLRRYGFERLRDLSLKEWASNRGIGRVRACQARAVFELGRRAWAPKKEEEVVVSGPKEAYRQVKDLARARKEHLVALYLDAQNHLIARETVSVGSLNTTRTHPREIFQPAIVLAAMGVILAHNHPSGSLTPSQEDVDFTRAIRRASEILGIGLYDHIIVSEKGYVSLKEKGLMA
jgi:DNA repair protein RadC